MSVILLQFCTDLFETLHVLFSWYGMWFGYNCLIDYFCHFFHFVKLVIFRPQCIDSGYLVFSMVWRCACGLDIMILHLFLSLSPLCELCHFLTSDSLKVYRQWIPYECNCSNNFMPIFLKLCFFHGLEICKWFGYNPWINFCHFLHFVNLVIFWPQILWKCIDSGTLWAQLLI